MTDYSGVGGHWVLPNVDVLGTQVRAHVSVAVAAEGEFTTADVDLALLAGDTVLAQLTRPGPDNPLWYTHTRSTGAAAFFTFDNPENLRPTAATVTLLGESLTLDVQGQDPPPLEGDPGSLPMV